MAPKDTAKADGTAKAATAKTLAAKPRTRAASTGTGASAAKPAKLLHFEDRIFAGVHRKNGRLATIREVLATDIPTRSDRELSLDERVSLAARRIRAEHGFVSMRMLGVQGIVDKKRALLEIRERSSIGLHLLEIDLRCRRIQIEQALAARANKKRTRNGSGNDGLN